MMSLVTKQIILGLVVLITGLGTVYQEARPPGKGDKRRPGPPPDSEFMTMRGTVRELTTAPRGEIDGLILNDGTWVHWPPHLQDRFKDIVAKGDRVRAAGYWETGPRGDTKLEVSVLTNLDTNKTAENPDRPPASADAADRPEPRAGQIQTVRGTVRERTTAPRGEVDGLILNDGTWVHWPPHLQDRFKDIVAKGDRVRAVGYWETGPKGDTKLEVSVLTNVDTNKIAENPDRPSAGLSRQFPGKMSDIEGRLKAIEERLNQLQKEIARLRRDR